MTQELGKLCGPDAKRDAIHVAIVPVVAAENLRPGWRVSLNDQGWAVLDDSAPIGIVDPFLKGFIHIGQRFWLCLMPGTVTGMTHHWSHPAFDKHEAAKPLPTENNSLEKRLIEQMAMECGKSYERLMEDAKFCAENEDYVPTGHDEDYKSVDWDAFWPAFSKITGIEPPKYRDSPYSCAC